MIKTHNTLRRLLGRQGWVLALSLLLLLAGAPAAKAAPPLPSSFYGAAQLDGAGAPEGALVSAWIDGAKIAETTVRLVNGQSVYALDVLGDDPDTPVIEGGAEGAAIHFRINGVETAQSAAWQLGAYANLNLTAVTPPPLPVAAIGAANGLNVARLEDGATIADFSSAGSGAPAGAIDANPFSSWTTASGRNANEYITVDLVGDRPQVIDQVALRANDASNSPRRFELLVSTSGIDAGDFTLAFAGQLLRTGQMQSFAFPPVEARYVKLRILDNWGGANIQLMDLAVRNRTRQGGLVSLAAGPTPASVVAFSSQANSTTTSAARAIDYDQDSYWRTTGAANQWIKVALARNETYLVDRIKLRAFANDTAPRHFQLLVSTGSLDDADFHPVMAGVMANDGHERWFTFAPTPAHYVKLLLLDNHGNATEIRLRDFQIFAANMGGATVPFEDLSTSAGDPITAWAWDFGDGATSTERHPTHTYSQPGDYTVTLTVENAVGAAGASMVYTVLPPATVSFTVSPESIREGTSATFTDTSTPGEGSVFIDRAWRLSHITGELNTPTVIRSFPDNGEYTISLTRLDNYFVATTHTHTLTVLNVPPIVTGAADQTIPVLDAWKPDLTVADVAADADTLVCTWDLGDGQTRQISPCNSTTVDVSHTYAAVGAYTAVVTVTDKDNDSATASMVVTVRKRDARLAIVQAQSVSPTEADVQLALWDEDARAPMTGRAIELRWDNGIATVTTDANGMATARIPYGPEQTVTLIAHYAGDEHYIERTVTVDTLVDGATQFWLAFPTNANNAIGNGGYFDMSLFVSSEQNSSGLVEIAGLGFRAPFTASPGVATKVTLPLDVRMAPGTGTSAKGVHVIAANQVSVYGMSYKTYTSDAYLALRTDLLGTDYLVMSRHGMWTGAQLTVVATEDNTTIAITPTVGAPSVVQLNQGDVHQLMLNVEGDLTGSVVRAEKPVAVFGGHNAAYVPDNPSGQYSNHLIEQMYPVTTWGKKFVTLPLAGRSTTSPGDRIRVLAAHDNTHVTINGAAVATLKRGQFYEGVYKTAAYIIADRPVLVAQYAQGLMTSGNPGDPSMMLIPPYEQFLTRYPAVIAPDITFTAHYINVVAPVAAVGAITLDETPIPAAHFTTIGESGFAGAQVAVEAGSHSLASPLPFGLFMYGYGDADAYSYAGGLTLGEIALAAELTLTPVTALQTPGAPHCVAAAIQDEAGAPLGNLRVDFTVTGAHTALGSVVTGANGEAAFCYTGTSEGADAISAMMGDLSVGADVTWSVAPVNRAPVAVDDAFTIAEDSGEHVLDLLVNDSDPDGDALSIVAVSEAANGVAILDGDDVRYTPAADFHGLDHFTYTVTDGELTAIATVTVTVTPVNDAPVAMDDRATTPAGVPVTVYVLENDWDVDGDELTIIAVTQPVSGVAQLNADQSITYAPVAGFHGIDSFAYTVSDGNGGVATAVVLITVEAPPAIACELYPIALHQSTLTGKNPGDAVADIFNGGGPGNFGWLTWSGNPNAPTLVENLTPPGNSDAYVNPHDPADHVVSVGDWVRASPGIANARPVRDALDALTALDIIVPVWDAVAGQGNNLTYRVADFARVRLLEYQLPGQNRISVRFLGLVNCADAPVAAGAHPSDRVPDSPAPVEVESAPETVEALPVTLHLPLIRNN